MLHDNNQQNALEELLMSELSQRNRDSIADLINQKPEIFKELMKIYFANEDPISWRAAWVADRLTEERTDWLEPYIDQLIARLPTFRSDGLKRCSLKMLRQYPIPREHAGLVIKLCFDWLISSSEAVAIKVYAMDILYSLSIEEPEIKQELADSIEWRMQEESAGFKSHGLKILRKLYRELK